MWWPHRRATCSWAVGGGDGCAPWHRAQPECAQHVGCGAPRSHAAVRHQIWRGHAATPVAGRRVCVWRAVCSPQCVGPPACAHDPVRGLSSAHQYVGGRPAGCPTHTRAHRPVSSSAGNRRLAGHSGNRCSHHGRSHHGQCMVCSRAHADVVAGARPVPPPAMCQRAQREDPSGGGPPPPPACRSAAARSETHCPLVCAPPGVRMRHTSRVGPEHTGSGVCFSRAHGVVVSHPLRMRKALGSNPSVSSGCNPSSLARGRSLNINK